MTTKKILGVIFGLIFIGAFAFVLTWGILNWQQVKDGMSGSGLYTQEDLNNAYDDGYNSALTDKSEYDELVKSYRDEITRLSDENSKANSNYNDLQKENKSLQANISSLENDKSDLQEQLDEYKIQVQKLNSTISENNKKINDFKSQISQKEKEIENLKSIGENKDGEISNLNGQITSLRSQISSLQTVNSQLESTNQANLTTISNLNAQIASLNAQIVTLQNQYQGNQDTITALNDKISQLEKSIKYYEQFIANLESGENVVATFEFNGAVYSIQILQKGGKVLFPTPESTDYVIFNYWETESAEKVQDTSSYIISDNTKFIANVTLKFDVKFSVDGTVRDTQIIEKGHSPSLPSETPSKVGYDFDGWTLNGVDVVDPTQQFIMQNTTFIAKFTQKFTVTFMYENETKSTQQVRSGSHAENVEIENTTYKHFNGWKVNGEIVIVEDYEIVGATTFVADITYSYDVKFMVDGQQYGQIQIVESGKFASKPSDPLKDIYSFLGWTLNGSDVIDVSSYTITQETTFIAKFEESIPAFADADWQKISDISQEIASQNMDSHRVLEVYGWNVGDEKTFSLTTGEEITVVILGFNHDDLTSGGKAGISIGMKNLLATTYNINSTVTNVGGWDKSEMRTVTLVEYFDLLPSDLQKVIKAVNKKASAGDKSTTITTSSDKLWLLSVAEVYSQSAIKSSADMDIRHDAATYKAEGKQYAYYYNLIGDADPAKAQSQLVKRLSNGTGSANCWWLRSARFTNATAFHLMGDESDCDVGATASTYAHGVSFGFCI